MTIGTGSVSLTDLNNEFGGGYSLGSYYNGSSAVRSVDYAPNVPGSGNAISLSEFQGAKKNNPQSVTFTSSQNYTVSSYFRGAMVTYVKGGGGGGGVHSDYWGGWGGNGGNGGVASADTYPTPGQTYYIEVGAGGSPGYHIYGYKDNPNADGYGGGGGGESSAFGVTAGGGGGGAGGSGYSFHAADGQAAGGTYGGGGGQGYVGYYDCCGNLTYGGPGGYNQGAGGDGGGTGNNLGWSPGSNAGAGTGASDSSISYNIGGYEYVGSTTPGAGYVEISGYW